MPFLPRSNSGRTGHRWNENRHGGNRIRGRKLQRLRQQLFAGEPLCRECAKYGRVTEATIRDHIISLAEGGTDAADNIQPLCRACSDAKTNREAVRGRGALILEKARTGTCAAGSQGFSRKTKNRGATCK